MTTSTAICRSANNILDVSNRAAWQDLSAPARANVATKLMIAVEENAFLLAEELEQPDLILESSEVLSKSKR